VERLAFTVADSFLVRGVGLLLAPGVGDLDPPLRIGDCLRLVRPDGSAVASEVRSLHPLHAPNPIPNPFLVLPEFQPSDVPPGTAVWVASMAEPSSAADRAGGSTRHQQFAAKVAYASIFAKTVEEASENLVRLITKCQCGFDEGVTVWRAVVEDFVQPTDDVSQLNRFGASFSPDQWRRIFEQVQSRLP
jgi:hypothetical protein